MKRLLAAAASIFLGAIISSAHAIPQDNQTILDSPKWNPSTEQTSKALDAVRRYLSESGGENGARMLSSFQGYRVQFSGEKQNGCKLIKCNFFPAPEVGQFDADRHPDWKTTKVEEAAEGEEIWHIYYDPEIDGCTGFSLSHSP